MLLDTASLNGQLQVVSVCLTIDRTAALGFQFVEWPKVVNLDQSSGDTASKRNAPIWNEGVGHALTGMHPPGPMLQDTLANCLKERRHVLSDDRSAFFPRDGRFGRNRCPPHTIGTGPFCYTFNIGPIIFVFQLLSVRTRGPHVHSAGGGA